MDRLALMRVLADPSRHAVYSELSTAGHSLTLGEVAARTGLHPSTARLHLERLRDAGLVDSAPDRHGGVGRPHHLWALRPGVPPVSLEPDGFRLLSHLLADVAVLSSGASPGNGAAGSAAEVGRRHAAALPRPDGAGAAEAVCGLLGAMGFEPTTSVVGDRVEVTFASCPFREVAVAYPDLVCALHRGLLEGAAGPSAPVTAFSSLVDTDPCRAELSFRAVP